MKSSAITLAVVVALHATPGIAADGSAELEELLVTARRILTPDLGVESLDADQIARRRARSSDTASLLTGIPGVATRGAGGVSALPVIRGLADDRLRTQVDGVDIAAACPNHMNPPLSYIDPTAVASIDVYAGVTPVSVWLSTEFVRAAPGGTGEAKCSGNYAASLIAQAHAAEQGCDQVVWLDAVERRWVEEMGGMNLVFVYGAGESARLVTPALTGTLLPGITRASLLTLSRHLGIPAEEGRISIEDWQVGNASGEITEVFACGTAAVVTPVGSVKSATAQWTVGDGQPGPVTMKLRHALLDIQTGRTEDPFGWIHRIG